MSWATLLKRASDNNGAALLAVARARANMTREAAAQAETASWAKESAAFLRDVILSEVERSGRPPLEPLTFASSQLERNASASRPWTAEEKRLLVEETNRLLRSSPAPVKVMPDGIRQLPKSFTYAIDLEANPKRAFPKLW